MQNLIVLCLLGVLLTTTGCTPTTKIKTPLTARPVSTQKVVALDNGSIFQAAASRPLFEDRRARNVGDVLTITIAEVTTATEKSSTNGSNSGSLNLALPSISKIGFGGVSKVGSDTVKSGSSSDNAGNNAFTGTITVTVIEVLDNGNLLVSGEKLVTVKYANEYVRFYGIVNPNTISANNSVASTQVADVRLEYKNANHIDSAAVSTMFSRFFLAILPF